MKEQNLWIKGALLKQANPSVKVVIKVVIIIQVFHLCQIIRIFLAAFAVCLHLGLHELCHLVQFSGVELGEILRDRIEVLILTLNLAFAFGLGEENVAIL